MGRGSAPIREISFVSVVAYGPKVSHSALAMGVTVSETRQDGSQQSIEKIGCPEVQTPYHISTYSIQEELPMSVS